MTITSEKLGRALGHLVLILLPFVFAYVCGVFITGRWSPSEWVALERIAVIFIWLWERKIINAK